MRRTMNSQVIRGKGLILATIVLALIVGTLSVAPSAKAWFSFSVWYGNRTATSVIVYWTVRPQEDSPSTPAEQVHICWTTSPTDYPCNSQGTYLSQFQPVNSTNNFTINTLSCSAYRVSVAQPYVVGGTGDWEEKIIDVPACPPSSNPAAGAALWLRSDAGVTLASGDVSSWADQSGNGRHATMPTAARRPGFIASALNGKPVIRFYGAQSLSLTSWVSSQQFTVFVVGKNNRPTETNSMILGPGGSSPNNQIRWENGIRALFVGSGMSSVTREIGNTRTYHLLSARYNGSQMNVYRDGYWKSWHQFTISGPWTTAQIGAYYSSSFMMGDIAEILIYPSALSDADQTTTVVYLKSKYALP